MNSNEFLKEAQEFMKEHGFDVPIQAFLDSDKIRAAAYEQLDNMKAKADFLTSNVPETLRERAEEMGDRMKEMQIGTFMKDIRSSFICNLYGSLMEGLRFSENSAFRETIIENVKLAVSEENDRAVELVNELMEEYAEGCMDIFLRELYREYVPEGIPEEARSLIQEITGEGGICIPAEVLMRMYGMENESD